MDQDQDNTRLNLTDADARLMKGKKKYKDTFYNVQAAVSGQQIILHNDVCTSSSDKQQLQGIVNGIEHNTECPLEVVICDSGYSSFDNEEYLEKRNITGLIPDQDFGKSYEDQPFHPTHFRFDSKADCYICPQDKKLVFWRNKKEKGYQWRVYRGEACQNCPFLEQCTKGKARTIARERRQDLRDEMRERLQSPYGKEQYTKRRYLIEPVFGHLFRNLGYTYFHMRGLEKVKAEFNLMCIAYNLMKMAMFLVVFLLKNVLEPFIRAEKRLVAF